MPFIKKKGCKICQSRIRDAIDKMLVDEKATYTDIIVFAAKRHLKLNKYNLSTHNTKHTAFKSEEVEIELANRRAKGKYKKRVRQRADMMEALQAVIDEFYEGLEKGELKPSITEGLKAIELMQRFGSGSPIEGSLMEFIRGVSCKS